MLGSRRSRLLPWLGLAIAGPALALGGVWPATIPGFAAVVALALAHLRSRGTRPRIPTAALLGLFAAAVTLLQVLPLAGLRAIVAPGLDGWVAHAQPGLDASSWPSLSPVPVDTGLEVLRLLALTGLVLVCAQRSWRLTAAVVVVTGTVVATIGLVQHGLHIDQIYGVYEARHPTTGREGTLLSTFVNPNHQSGLLLLGIFSAAGLGLAHAREDARAEPRLLLGIALVIQGAALVLSMSRAALLAGAVAALVAVGLAVTQRPRPLRRDRSWVSSLLWVSCLLAVIGGLGTLGAWDELLALRNADGLDSSTALRVRTMAGSLSLLDLAPLTGIGRGAFADVFTAFDPDPSHVWISHLECAPLAMIVELGVPGLVLAVAIPTWWLTAMRRAGSTEDAVARRIVLLGLLALGLQGLADFSLEFLGVAAPACALAGALSPTSERLGRRSIPRGPIVVLLGLAVLGVLAVPHAWASLSLRSGPDDTPVTDSDVARRPLHAGLHRRRARDAVARGQWATAHARARAAVRLQPSHVDGWLLLAAAERGRGHTEGERRAMAEALRHLHRPASPELVDHLTTLYDPDALARLAPAGGPAWPHLMDGLLARAPRHADAVARARSARHPTETEPLRALVEANLRLERPALALHHARLWRQHAPSDAHAHLAVVRALEAHQTDAHQTENDGARAGARREALERALAEADLDDLHLRGLVEEQLLRAMLRHRTSGDDGRIHELAVVLRTRPASDEVRRRRLALVTPLLTPRRGP